jgi:hypothetical protein
MEATMTTTPYADHWRECTLERMERLGLDVYEVAYKTGLIDEAIQALRPDGEVTLDIAGPIDELLAKLEDAAEAKALEDGPAEAVVQLRNGRVHPVRRVDVKLDALTDCDVVLHGRPR